MGKGTKAKRDKKKDGRQGKIGGEKSSPNAPKQTVSTDDGGGGTSSQHKHDDSNSVQNNKAVDLEPEAGPSGSGSQQLSQRDTEKEDCNSEVAASAAEERSSGGENWDSEVAASAAEERSSGGENWDSEVAASADEERSSGGEICQAAGGGHGWGEEQPEAWDPWSDEGEQRGNEGRNEDNRSRDRSDDQKGRQDKGNWRTDRRTGTDDHNRSAGDRGGRGRDVKREGKGHKIVKEVFGDLFDAPKEWSLAHCVATDMRMGSGIAVSFRQNFKNVVPLLEQGARVGHIAVLEHEGRYIYYLVTKKYSTGKPFFEDVVSSLQKMRDHCAEHGVKHLAMPRIGCGLDRLEWRDVRPKIEEIFSGLDISITVYNFNQPETEEDGQHARKKRHLPVTHRMHRLVTIEPQTALLFFGSEDGSVDECGKDLDRKFNFLLEYKKERKTVGDVVRLEKRNEVLYGLIVRKKESDAFSYINFEKCLSALRKLVKKDEFLYIGIEAFCVSNDDATMEKVITVMKNVLTAPELELFVCWPKELEHCHRDSVDMSDQREGRRK